MFDPDNPDYLLEAAQNGLSRVEPWFATETPFDVRFSMIESEVDALPDVQLSGDVGNEGGSGELDLDWCYDN